MHHLLFGGIFKADTRISVSDLTLTIIVERSKFHHVARFPAIVLKGENPNSYAKSGKVDLYRGK